MNKKSMLRYTVLVLSTLSASISFIIAADIFVISPTQSNLTVIEKNEHVPRPQVRQISHAAWFLEASNESIHNKISVTCEAYDSINIGDEIILFESSILNRSVKVSSNGESYDLPLTTNNILLFSLMVFFSMPLIILIFFPSIKLTKPNKAINADGKYVCAKLKNKI